MPTINVTVRNKIAKSQPPAFIVCGNSDYTAVFDLDDEWAEFPNRVAVFVYQVGRERRNERVIFDGDECPIPTLRGVRAVEVGLEAGNIRTTTPARIRCFGCITDAAGTPQEPDEDVYGQILERADNMAQAATAAARDAQTAQTAASAAASSAQTAQDCAQAMAGTFDFTGYMRYRVVTELPEQQDDNVLYLIVENDTAEPSEPENHDENGGTE
nr:MAG TPA: hypothetical protein [Caudoviricetes sp.]